MELADVASEIEFTVNLVKRVGKLLLQYFREGQISVQRKKDQTVVTYADLRADEIIHSQLQKYFRSDFILSEELSTILPSNSLQGWIIDPLDGTTNFALGLSCWGILITRVQKGYPVFTIQYFPALDELYQAQVGQPSRLNERIICVEAPSYDQRLTVFACCSRTYQKYEVGLRYKVRILGSAGYSMASVARGIARLAFDAQAKLWDIAGAWLLVSQAKGTITALNGISPFPLREACDYASQTYPTLAAASPEFLKEGLDKIKPKSNLS